MWRFKKVATRRHFEWSTGRQWWPLMISSSITMNKHLYLERYALTAICHRPTKSSPRFQKELDRSDENREIHSSITCWLRCSQRKKTAGNHHDLLRVTVNVRSTTLQAFIFGGARCSPGTCMKESVARYCRNEIMTWISWWVLIDSNFLYSKMFAKYRWHQLLLLLRPIDILTRERYGRRREDDNLARIRELLLGSIVI